jgi:preprotein translocase subunit YajC
VNNSFGAALPLLLLGLAFVVLIVLPQRARSRLALQAQQLQQSLSVGTEIMTTSGLYGRITALDEKTIDLEIAPGVVVRWARAAVGEVRGPQPEGDGPFPPAEEAGE